MNTPLSNIDINNLVKEIDHKGANFYEMNKIKSNTPLEHVFKHRGHAVLFVKYPKEEVGHWVICLRNHNNTCMYFDSLGGNPNEYNKNFINFLKKNIKMTNRVYVEDIRH